MNVLQIFALIFFIHEIWKMWNWPAIFIGETKTTEHSRQFEPLSMPSVTYLICMELAYTVFAIILIFTKIWYCGCTLIGISIVTALIRNKVIKQYDTCKQYFSIHLADFLVSSTILGYIFFVS
jgi:hypothetical protein